MRTGKLGISRGHEIRARQAQPLLPPEPVSFAPQPELDLIQVRLQALERLARLVKQGMLSADEFALEKSLILRLTGDELLLTEPIADPVPRPALFERRAAALVAILGLTGGAAWFAWPTEIAAMTSGWFGG